jgi:hypothetical protein
MLLLPEFCVRCYGAVWGRTQLRSQTLVKEGIALRARDPSPGPSRP